MTRPKATAFVAGHLLHWPVDALCSYYTDL